eukprot:gene548-1049_t
MTSLNKKCVQYRQHFFRAFGDCSTTDSNTNTVNTEMTEMKSVAIIGGGFAGLGCAYHARKYTSKITIFDKNPVGSAASSSVAAGMMHPLSPQCKLIWKGAEGYQATSTILKDLNQDVVLSNTNILRPCLTEAHKAIYSTSAKILPQFVEWISKSEYSELTNNINPNVLGALRIKNSKIINCPLYLQSIWNYITQSSNLTSTSTSTPNLIIWENQNINNIQDIQNKFDIIFITCGANINDLWQLPLPIQLVRGQSLIYQNNMNNNKNENNPNIPHEIQYEVQLQQAILCGEYIVPTGNNQIIAGATHEYNNNFNDLQAPTNLKIAYNLLKSKIENLYPPLASVTPIGSLAGIRVNSKRTNLGKLPILNQHPTMSNVWMMTALGSRGLIHHALLSQMLVDAAFSNDITLIPEELRPVIVV